MKRLTFVGLIALTVALAPVAHAQFTADFQTNIISSVASNWSGSYIVGSNTFADVLLIQSAGVLSNGSSYLGYEISSTNNTVIVTDGSIWSNSYLSVGKFTGTYTNIGANTLAITNSGQVVCGGGRVNSSGNSFLVSGTGSVWNVGTLSGLGLHSAGNSLTISNGGRISGGVWLGVAVSNNVVGTGPGSVCSGGIGLGGGSGNNVTIQSGCLVGGLSMDDSSNSTALVTDPGTIVSNKYGIKIGDYGRGNSLVVSNGAKLISQGGTLAQDNASSNNSVVLIGSGSVWSNSADLRVGDYGKSNSLVADSGAQVFNNYAYIGYRSGADKNVVFIGGSGSIWSNRNDLYIGGGPGNNVGNSVGNCLVISNGGKVYSGASFVGYNSTASNNSAVITGGGSLWTNVSSLLVGASGSSNSLTVGNGGKVANASDLCVGSDSVRNSVKILSSGTVLNAFGYIGSNQTASGNSVVISDAGSLWNNSTNLFVGYSGAGNSLLISNAGRVFNSIGYVGCNLSSSNNNLLVSDTGSVWSNRGDVYVGYSGSGSSLVISNGGRVRSNNGYVGFFSSDNSVVVTGNGSVWTNRTELFIGVFGSGNHLEIRDGGQVRNNSVNASGFFGYIGSSTSSSNNSVLVTGIGSVWTNRGGLHIGYVGVGNSLVISNGGLVGSSDNTDVGSNFNCSNNNVRVVDNGLWLNNILHVGENGSSNSVVVDGGSVVATNLTIGVFASATCNNLVQLDNGNLVVTNSAGGAVLEVRRGSFIFNGGTVRADQLVITNSCARFNHNGGTLIVGSLLLDSSLDADGDGMANGWEQAYGLDPLNAADAGADNDGDGFTNLQEFQAGTNSTNASSAFRVLSLESTNNDIRVTWLAGGGCTNLVQSAPDLTGSYSNISPDIILPGTGDVTTNYVDTGGATNGNRFYKIRLVP